MSALGQKRTFRDVRLMSALPPKADMGQQGRGLPLTPATDSRKSLPISEISVACQWQLLDRRNWLTA